MKKILSKIFLFLSLLIIGLLIILSTIGIETKKFNKFISNKIYNQNKNINLSFNTIKFKVDIKEISLFLETINPQVFYRETLLPVKNIKVYIDFESFLKNEQKFEKVNITFNQINMDQFREISSTFKPSNITSFLKNKIEHGKLESKLEIFFNNKNEIDNFIAKGKVYDLKIRATKDLIFEKTNFDFFADKTDVLIKNISSGNEYLLVKDGDLKIKLLPEIRIESNFISKIDINTKVQKNYLNFKDKFKLFKDISTFQATLNNNFFFHFDRTYKIKKYDIKSTGKISKGSFKFKKSLSNTFISEEISQINFFDAEIKTNINPNENKTSISGKYSINQGGQLNFNIKQNIEKDLLNVNLNLDYDKLINLNVINYEKPENVIANISLNFDKRKDNFKIKKFQLSEQKSSIILENILIKKNKFISLKNISAKTYKKDKINNDFEILFGKKIYIKGSHFDASNLPKFFNQKSKNSILSKVNKEIEIDFKNIVVPLSEKLENFKLIGEINDGRFVKISSKGSFEGDNFLDITMKFDKKNKKKYLEVYSDLPQPLLTEYNFFKGLSGGKLIFSSIIEDDYANSKLVIENFKVINAPGMVKLLSLADLRGLADLAEGDGLSFDILEIKMEKSKENLKLNEIIALGPSISVLMEGYQDPSVTSLRGTLVPAKTLNKMISKIPVIGEIIIPKEIGEGLFGISFKMKGPPGNIKTTINPIRTLTPRFIQKIIDRNKKKSN